MTQTEHYLHYALNYPAYAKIGMVHISVYRANMICQSKQNNNVKKGKLRKALLSNAYLSCFVVFILLKRSRTSSVESRIDVRPLDIVSLPHVTEVSGMFKRISGSVKSKPFLKLDINLVGISEDLNLLGKCRRGQNVFTKSLVDVGDSILVKKIDHWLYD
jgi:hypothetical protein